MRRQVLLLTTSALILAYGAMAATAQGTDDSRSAQPSTDDPRTGGFHGARGHDGSRHDGRGHDDGPPIMMRMIFALMDADGDGTISLQEFQAAHERIFKAMDANKDGRLTPEEMQAFMQGTRRSVPPQ